MVEEMLDQSPLKDDRSLIDNEVSEILLEEDNNNPELSNKEAD